MHNFLNNNLLLPLLFFFLLCMLVWGLFSFVTLYQKRSQASRRNEKQQMQKTDLELNSFYQDSIGELIEQREAGIITQEQFEDLDIELQQNVLSMSQTRENRVLNERRNFTFFPLLVIICGLLLCVYTLSTPRTQAVSQWIGLKQQWVHEFEDFYQKNKDIRDSDKLSSSDFISLTQAYLQAHPHDAQVWYKLGLLYLRGERLKPAGVLLRRALAEDPQNFEFRLAHIQYLVAEGSEQSLAQAEQSIATLGEEHNDHQMLWMTRALLQQKQGHLKQALRSWHTIKQLQLQSGQEQDSTTVDAYIAQLEQQITELDSQRSASLLTQVRELESSKQPLLKEQHAKATLLTVTVDAAQSDKEQFNKGSVFVIVKFAERPMPIAVKRLEPTTWPLELSISDEDSLLQNQTLSQALKSTKELQVIARYSFSGLAKPRSGDFYSMAQPWHSDTTHISLKLDQQLP